MSNRRSDRAARSDIRSDRQNVRAALSCQRRNPLPIQARTTYVRAGYGVRKPTPYNHATLHGILFTLFGVAFLFWLAHTPLGNQFAYWVAEHLMGVK